MDHLCYFWFVFIMLSRASVFDAHLLFMPCHLLGKGWAIGFRLWCLIAKLSLSHWCPGSGVVLDFIDSWFFAFFINGYLWLQVMGFMTQGLPRDLNLGHFKSSVLFFWLNADILPTIYKKALILGQLWLPLYTLILRPRMGLEVKI